MIKVNALALYLYNQVGKGKLAPPYTGTDRQGGAQRGDEIFLEFFAGIDLGVNVKTKRRKNSARHERHDNKIRKWNYRRLGTLIEAGQGLCKRIPQAFSPPHCAPPCRVFTS
jgi:hypothetical protein